MPSVRWLQALCFGGSCLPALWLALQAWQGTLGVDPLDRLTRFTGHWAAIFLLLTLSITPLRRASMFVARRLSARWGRRVADWSVLLRLRRQLGLFCFAYAATHAAIHFVLHAGGEVVAWLDDVTQKRYLQAGLATLLLLLPLALTSTDAAMRRLKKNWRRLHWLVYPAAVLALVHDALQVKHGAAWPWASQAWLLLLLGARVPLGWAAWRGRTGANAAAHGDADAAVEWRAAERRTAQFGPPARHASPCSPAAAAARARGRARA